MKLEALSPTATRTPDRRPDGRLGIASSLRPGEKAPWVGGAVGLGGVPEPVARVSGSAGSGNVAARRWSLGAAPSGPPYRAAHWRRSA